MKTGLDKIAQGEQETEVAAPEQPMNNDSTTITCLSDCMYAQNPEKTCMLKNVSLNMSDQGAFECGQYKSAQQMAPEMQQAMPGQQSQAAPEQQAQQPTGLDKVK
jgi:hypothetical protein